MHRTIVVTGLSVVLASIPHVRAAAVEIDSDTFWPEDDYTVDVLAITNGARLTVA